MGRLTRGIALVALLASCGAPPAAPSLVLGTYVARDVEVVDGDTLKLADGTRVRVLDLDTEEVFRSEERRARATRDFDAYAHRMQGDVRTPQKYATPAGEAASRAARRLLATARAVRLERDRADAPATDRFGRALAHVFLVGETYEILLAEALIREGHSPNFVKYGRSVRFDARLRAAEAEARDAGRGIWSTSGLGHYPDYPERLAWWHLRADQVDRWRRAPRAPHRVDLEAPDAGERLEGLVGRRAKVFGLVRNRKDMGRPRILWLRHRPKRDFAVVVFDDEVWRALDHDAVDRLYVTVEGPVSLYRGHPQIVVEDARWISTDVR